MTIWIVEHTIEAYPGSVLGCFQDHKMAEDAAIDFAKEYKPYKEYKIPESTNIVKTVTPHYTDFSRSDVSSESWLVYSMPLR